jgi:hypothetical protein
MGNVPTTPRQAAIASVNCISNAILSNNNILMVDVRLPSYDITEGMQYYDPCAVYDLATFMAEEMQQKKLVNKCLILVRDENQRVEILKNREVQRQSKREEDGSIMAKPTTALGEEDADIDMWEISEEPNNNNIDDLDDFRKKLISSWISTGSDNNSDKDEDNDDNDSTKILSEKKPPSPSPPVGKKSVVDSNPNFSSSSINLDSHRLWSMIGNEDISSDDDAFHRIISAVDSNARLLDDEDAIIILSPYTTNDMIAIRRILARYCGQSSLRCKTVILVNSRLEVIPKEMDSAVFVYGMLPLVARAKQQQQKKTNYMDSRGEVENDNDDEPPGLKAVAMKRYPNDWTVYVDVSGDGFVEATKNNRMATGVGVGVSSSNHFPSPEWIAMRVQAHVEGLVRE